MSPHIARRLKAASKIMMVCVPVALMYEFIDTSVVSAIGVTIGVVLAMPLVLLEESGFDKRIARAAQACEGSAPRPHRLPYNDGGWLRD